MQRRGRFLPIIAAMVAAVGLVAIEFSTPLPASACIGPVDLSDVDAHAETIILGTVVWVSGRPIVGRVDFDVAVTSVLRGSAPNRIAVRDLVADYCGDHAVAWLGDRVILALNVHVSGKALNPVWPKGRPSSIFAPAGTSFDEAIALLSGPLPPTDAVQFARGTLSADGLPLVGTGLLLLTGSVVLLRDRPRAKRFSGSMSAGRRSVQDAR